MTAMDEQERIAARAKADPEYRWMLMEDADLYARQEAEEAEPLDANRIAHGFAIKYGLLAHLTYEQAMGLERDLTTHLRAWGLR